MLPDEYVGEGIKKTLAYETDLTKDELEEMRKDFWSTGRCKCS